MTEKNMQTFFKKYLEKHPPEDTEVYELKICKGTSLPFRAVEVHQIDALMKAANGSYYHKIQDSPVSWGQDTKVRFTKKKPFDCLVLRRVKAFVVVWFYHERQKKVFIKIPIAIWNLHIQHADRKSITEQQALEIGQPLYL